MNENKLSENTNISDDNNKLVTINNENKLHFQNK